MAPHVELTNNCRRKVETPRKGQQSLTIFANPEFVCLFVGFPSSTPKWPPEVSRCRRTTTRMSKRKSRAPSRRFSAEVSDLVIHRKRRQGKNNGREKKVIGPSNMAQRGQDRCSELLKQPEIWSPLHCNASDAPNIDLRVTRTVYWAGGSETREEHKITLTKNTCSCIIQNK